MSITTPKVPPEILRAFTSGIGDFVAAANPLWSLLLTKYVPFVTYNLVLEGTARVLKEYPNDIPWITLEPGDPPGAPDASTYGAPPKCPLLLPTGWRFLVADGDLYGGCHVAITMPNHPARLTGFSTSSQVLTALENYGEIEDVLASDQVAGSFEVRVLRIPWLKTEAFWLRSQDGGNDRLLPYYGCLGKVGEHLDLMDEYTVPKFLDAIRPLTPDPDSIGAAQKASEAKRIQDEITAQENILKNLQAQQAKLGGKPPGYRADQKKTGDGEQSGGAKKPTA